MAAQDSNISCTVVLHDSAISKQDVLCGTNILPAGSIAYLRAPGAKALCVCSQVIAGNPDEISVHVAVAKSFGFENRMKASVHLVKDIETATATHVELSFRDQDLSRADMWRMKAQIDESVLYGGQKLQYLGSPIASVEAIYIGGNEVDSAYISRPQTKLIFRSGSARYTILIQVSKEMLENWIEGDLMYERLLTGFLPDLFQRWEALKVRHTVTVVLFGRVMRMATLSRTEIQEPGLGVQQDVKPADFFHVVASNLASGDWRNLLRKLKKAFNDVHLPRQVSLAAKGTMLHAIHMAGMDFSHSAVDPHLGGSGSSIVAITAGAGLFEADYHLLKSTTELLMGSSIGVDIISLSAKPLHPVPLFQYERGGRLEYALPHWADISHWSTPSEVYNCKWLLPDCLADINDVTISTLDKIDSTAAGLSPGRSMDDYDEYTFSSAAVSEGLSLLKLPDGDAVAKRFPAVKGVIESVGTHGVSVQERSSNAVVDENVRTPGLASPGNVAPPKGPKPALSTPHPLLQMGRKISLGPKGLALSQGIASTTVSAQHAQSNRDPAAEPALVTQNAPSGLAKQIRESLRRKPSQQSLVSQPATEIPLSSAPINIQNGGEHVVEDLQDPTRLIEKAVMAQTEEDSGGTSASLSATSTTNRDTLSLRHARNSGDQKIKILPWLTLLNPCNPRMDNMQIASEYRQWQNIFPRPVSSGAFKWDSLCTPAVLPLMTEFRISMTELEKRLQKKVKRLLATKIGAHQAMLQMVALRLIAGFQMVPTRKFRHAQAPSDHIERILMSLGGEFHEIQCPSDVEVQVSEYTSPADVDTPPGLEHDSPLEYFAKVRSVIARKGRTVDINLRQRKRVLDRSHLDDQSVNTNALTESLGTSRMRLVLIPVDIARTDAQRSQIRELSDEERRIDGIQRLTQLWQRHRYFPGESERQNSLTNKVKSPSRADRDPNPLAIEYQTRDPSAFVSAYGMTLTSHLATGDAVVPLPAESEMYRADNFDTAKLVKQMQEPPPKGVELRDRRWLTRLHLKCFRGDEMTNWLLRVFKDLPTREDGVALGNQLMSKDIFTHVRGKHEFRDGNYFYQIMSAHRTTVYPDSTGFFAKAMPRSVPSTPNGELKHSPTVRPAQGDLDSSSRGTSTPSLAPVNKQEKREVLLSQMLQYNVDSGRRSTQPEVINLHYDRIHNPENCYHIQLDWTSTTPKLIRDSVIRWSSLVESQGLKLVQLPLVEASKVHLQHPFDQTVSIQLALRPPDKLLATPHLDPNSFSPRAVEDPNGYHKALLRKMDFVLDLEAASSFPRLADVSYSWGRPDYELTQFIHKSGLLLAQISNNGRTDFLLLQNRLAPQSPAVSKKADVASLDSLVQSFVSLCRNEAALKTLFEIVDNPKLSVPSPLSNAAFAADSDVPPMELPPHLIHRSLKPSDLT